MRAGEYWTKSQDLKLQQVLHESQTVSQEQQQTPIMFGCDVVGLYPNLDPISVAQVTAQAVLNTSVRFKSVNFYFLIVYLVLTLGVIQMQRIGLRDCIARKKTKNNVNSLAATSNRDMNTWDFSHIKLDDKKKKK